MTVQSGPTTLNFTFTLSPMTQFENIIESSRHTFFPIDTFLPKTHLSTLAHLGIMVFGPRIDLKLFLLEFDVLYLQ